MEDGGCIVIILIYTAFIIGVSSIFAYAYGYAVAERDYAFKHIQELKGIVHE
jgi:hypothetical protein